MQKQNFFTQTFTRTEQLAKELRFTLYNPGFGQDVLIKTDKNKKLYTYSSILSIRSEKFRDLIKKKKEETQNENKNKNKIIQQENKIDFEFQKEEIEEIEDDSFEINLDFKYNYEVVKTALEYVCVSICNLPVIDPNQNKKSPFELTCNLLSFAKKYALGDVVSQCI
ncbi:btb/poz and taz domain-containing protein [Anaeramoeba ignava]|uniref:Btb/poz and taz domain-containing protein n=1 Tax=Anaeramoeba ignava TaxID=1746090 RepID=A0A9Q0R9X2_ANAIG|nr:btb/poz and taz domain-containing protein [Anaeramoeba ignava]